MYVFRMTFKGKICLILNGIRESFFIDTSIIIWSSIMFSSQELTTQRNNNSLRNWHAQNLSNERPTLFLKNWSALNLKFIRAAEIFTSILTAIFNQ